MKNNTILISQDDEGLIEINSMPISYWYSSICHEGDWKLLNALKEHCECGECPYMPSMERMIKAIFDSCVKYGISIENIKLKT